MVGEISDSVFRSVQERAIYTGVEPEEVCREQRRLVEIMLDSLTSVSCFEKRQSSASGKDSNDGSKMFV